MYNEILTGRHNRFMQKLFGMKGAAPAPQLSGDIQVMHPIFHGVENRYLESWDRFAFMVFAAGVAAQATSVRFRNPSGSNVMVVVEKLTAQNAVADLMNLDRGAPPQTDLLVVAPTLTREDSRGRPNCTLIFSVNNAGNPTVALNNQDFVTVAAGSSAVFIQTINQEYPILPGDALQVRANTVAANAILVGVRWRERALEDSELR
jgi:hypothetical protein